MNPNTCSLGLFSLPADNRDLFNGQFDFEVGSFVQGTDDVIRVQDFKR